MFIAMKYNVLFLIIFWFIVGNVFPQEKNFVIRTGGGYYMDTFTGDDGPIIWLEGGYKFKTGFNLNARVSMSTIDWNIRAGVFQDYKTIQHRQMLDLTFSRPIALKGNNFLEPGVGFKLKREYLLKPDVVEVYDNGTYILYTSYSDIFYEIGFTICLDYYYQFQSNFYMGMRADANVIWALGFEGLTISPLFGFRF
jgi:hypothetical protein